MVPSERTPDTAKPPSLRTETAEAAAPDEAYDTQEDPDGMRRMVFIADANVDRADPADAIGSTPTAEEVAVRCCRPTLRPGPEAIEPALVSTAVARAGASATRASARLRIRISNTRGVDRSARAKFWLRQSRARNVTTAVG